MFIFIIQGIHATEPFYIKFYNDCQSYIYYGIEKMKAEEAHAKDLTLTKRTMDKIIVAIDGLFKRSLQQNRSFNYNNQVHQSWI